MSSLMSLEQAMDWYLATIALNPEKIVKPEGFLRHISLTSDIASQTVDSIVQHYPTLSPALDKGAIVLAALLHDIAVPSSPSLFHELYGAQLVEENESVGAYCDRIKIAQMIRSHFIVGEEFNDSSTLEDRKPFENLDPTLLFPRTWQEQILVWSDLTNSKGVIVSYHQRLNDIRERYTSNPQYVSLNPSRARIMQTALPRLVSLCDRVERFTKGELDEGTIARYGFL